MRKPTFRNALLTALALPGLALAQQQLGHQINAAKNAGGSSEPAAAAEAPATEGSSTLAPGANPEGGTQPASAHTVEKGDTLWDLSQKYLGSPWYWPKVWSYNPEIANPHWIYPGNTVRFFQNGEETPTQVEVGQGPEPTADVDETPFVPDEDERVSTTGPIGYVPKKAISLQATGFVTTSEVEETGVIEASFGETEMMSWPQTFYARLKANRTPKLGEMFVIYRSAGEVTHPVTQKPVGYITKIVGGAKVVKVDKGGLATCTIEKQFDDIRRGDYLGPMGESMIHSVGARPNERDLKDAYVVGSTTKFLTLYGENHMIIIDKGADDGVKPGNIFTVWRAIDGTAPGAILFPNNTNENLPREDVGACMAFEVKSKATTCLVTKSIRDLVKGDKAEMRVGTVRSAMR